MQENKKNNNKKNGGDPQGFRHARLVLKQESRTTATSHVDSLVLIIEGEPRQAPARSHKKSFRSRALSVLKEILIPVTTGILVELAKQLLLKGQ